MTLTPLERKLMYRLALSRYEYDQINVYGTRWCIECDQLAITSHVIWHMEYMNDDIHRHVNEVFDDEYKVELCNIHIPNLTEYIIQNQYLRCPKCLEQLVRFNILYKHIACDYCGRAFMYDAGIPFHIDEGYEQELNIEYPEHLTCLNIKCDFDMCIECASKKEKAFTFFINNNGVRKIVPRKIKT
jgi:hypothetical protein